MSLCSCVLVSLCLCVLMPLCVLVFPRLIFLIWWRETDGDGTAHLRKGESLVEICATHLAKLRAIALDNLETAGPLGIALEFATLPEVGGA